MRRIVATVFTSVDGCAAAPDWHGAYFDDAMAGVVTAAMSRTTGYLLGRRLYDEWAAHWPTADDPFAPFVNALPKYLLTHRRDDVPAWSNTVVLPADDPDAVAAVKADGDGEIGLSGSATTVRWLLANGLLDELNLLVDPIAIGSGPRLLDGVGRTPLRLLGCVTLPTGVLHVRYAPA